MLFYLPKSGIRKVGFTATKKIGNAVVRNRAKRRMRSVFYENAKDLKDGNYIFVAKQSLIDIPYKSLQKDFHKIVSRNRAFCSYD